jgi:hypothetical protein
MLAAFVISLPKVEGSLFSCPHRLNSPSRLWLDGTSRAIWLSSPVSNNATVHADPASIVYSPAMRFEVRGMVYSPAPVGWQPGEPPYGDWYTEEYRHLWSVDIPRMAEIGINVLRVSNWKLHDAPSHLAFLDALFDHGLHVLITFDFTASGRVPDLANIGERRTVVGDFNQLVSETVRHPAVIGYLVGSDLMDVGKYGLQAPLLLTAVNEMVAAVRNHDSNIPELASCQALGCRHLVALPLDDSILNPTVLTYYAALDVDIWAINSYSTPSELFNTLSRYVSTVEILVNQSTDNDPRPWEQRVLKPVLIAERGTASVRAVINISGSVPLTIVSDEDAQATFVIDTIIAAASVFGTGGLWWPIAGVVLSEWTDEWWRGSAVNTLPSSFCGGADPWVYDDCGRLVGSSGFVVAEKKLGICAYQSAIANPDSSSASFLDGFGAATSNNLRCKVAFTRLCQQWNGRRCGEVEIRRRTAATESSVVLVAIVAPFACIAITCLCALLIFARRRLRKRAQNQRAAAHREQLPVNPLQQAQDDVDADAARLQCDDVSGLLNEAIPLASLDPRIVWIVNELCFRARIFDDQDRSHVVRLVASIAFTFRPPRSAHEAAGYPSAAQSSHVHFAASDDIAIGRLGQRRVLIAVSKAVADLHGRIVELYGLEPPRGDEPRPAPQLLCEAVLFGMVQAEVATLGVSDHNAVSRRVFAELKAKLFGDVPARDEDPTRRWEATVRPAWIESIERLRSSDSNGILDVSSRIDAAGERAVLVDLAMTFSGASADPTLPTPQLWAIRYAEDEFDLFADMMRGLALLPSSESVPTLHVSPTALLVPIAVDLPRWTLYFRSCHSTTCSAAQASGEVRRHGHLILAAVLRGLHALHVVGLAHGSVSRDTVGRTLDGKRERWALLPAHTFSRLTPATESADFRASADLARELSNHCGANTPIGKKLLRVAADLAATGLSDTPTAGMLLECAAYLDPSNTMLSDGKGYVKQLPKRAASILGATVAYSFFGRYMLWQWLWCYSRLPINAGRSLCLSATFELMAVCDAAFCIITYGLEIAAEKRARHRLAAALHGLLYAVAFALLVWSGNNVSREADSTTPLLQPAGIYLWLAIALFLGKDVLIRAPSGIDDMPHRAAASVLSLANWACLIVPLALFNDVDGVRLLSGEGLGYGPALILSWLLVAVFNGAVGAVGRRCGRRLRLPRFIGLPAVLWASQVLGFHALLRWFIVPPMRLISWELCSAPLANDGGKPLLWQQRPACHVGWVFAWGAAISVSLAAFHILFLLLQQAFAAAMACAVGSGELHSYADVVREVGDAKGRALLGTLLPRRIKIDSSQTPLIGAGTRIFEVMLDVLVRDHKLDAAERRSILRWIRGKEPRGLFATHAGSRPEDVEISSSDAEAEIVAVFEALKAMPVEEANSVLSMPPITFLVNFDALQDVVFDDTIDLAASEDEPEKSRVGLLITRSPEEWQRFVDELRVLQSVPSETSEVDLVVKYLQAEKRSSNGTCVGNDLVLLAAVETWVAHRSPTLTRSARGIRVCTELLTAVCAEELQLLGSRSDLTPDDVTHSSAGNVVATKTQFLVYATTVDASMTSPDNRRPSIMSKLLLLQLTNPLMELVFQLCVELNRASVDEQVVEMLHAMAVETEPCCAVWQTVEWRVAPSVVPLAGVGNQHVRARREFACHLVLKERTATRCDYELHAVEVLNSAKIDACMFARGAVIMPLRAGDDVCPSTALLMPARVARSCSDGIRTLNVAVRIDDRGGFLGKLARGRFSELSQDLSARIGLTMTDDVATCSNLTDLRMRSNIACPRRSEIIVRRVLPWDFMELDKQHSRAISAVLADASRPSLENADDWISRSNALLTARYEPIAAVALVWSLRAYCWSTLLLNVSEAGRIAGADVGWVHFTAWVCYVLLVSPIPGGLAVAFDRGLFRGVVRTLTLILPAVVFHVFTVHSSAAAVLRAIRPGSPARGATRARQGRDDDIGGGGGAFFAGFLRWGLTHYWRGVELLVAGVWLAAENDRHDNRASMRIGAPVLILAFVVGACLLIAPVVLTPPPSPFTVSRSGDALFRWLTRFQEPWTTFARFFACTGHNARVGLQQRSFRAWYASRVHPRGVAQSRRAWCAWLFIALVREAPIATLLLAYFSLPMLPAMCLFAAFALQVAMIRCIFTGRSRRRAGRVTLIAAVVFLVSVVLFYVGADVVFYSPGGAIALVLYGLRLVVLIGCGLLPLLRRTPAALAFSGLWLALFEYPIAAVAAMAAYGSAWVASNAFRDVLTDLNVIS